MNHYDFQPNCYSSHLGAWLCEPMRLSQMVEGVKSGIIQMKTPEMMAAAADERKSKQYPFQLVNGTAVIPVNGELQKAFSKFGGTSTVWIRQAVREAVSTKKVKSILLNIDSPGGHYAGTNELATDIKRASEAKPTWSYISDLGASAAYWLASQTSRIISNKTAEIGSIGTVAYLYDYSKAMEADGIKVHVVSTGKFKGAFAPGSEITDEQLDYVQELIDNANQHFQEAVESGRGLSKDELKAVSDGRVFPAVKAQALKLIDGIMPIEQALDELRAQADLQQPPQTGRGTLSLPSGARSNHQRVKALINIRKYRKKV